jgi:tRNA(Ile)-lysidine synthase
VEAATVDHRLRTNSAGEAAMVAEVCAGLGVPHAVLPVTVGTGSSLQRQAREVRYAALGQWAAEHGLAAVATAHHADDQAETLLMRLARGSGLAGLAGVREQRLLRPEVRLVRPLLGARKSELEALVAEAGLVAVDDPANDDPRHDRSWIRRLLAEDHGFTPERLARSATALGEAEEALSWMVATLSAERLVGDEDGLRLDAADLPAELQRRLLLAAFGRLGASEPRGPDMERALTALRSGGVSTLSGLKLAGGNPWLISPAPPRRS